MIFGLLRIKNESRWIERVIRSIQPVCGKILVLDDHSDDGTPEICERLGCVVYRSEFDGIHEARDKDFLLSKLWEHGAQLGDWGLMVDGDEALHPDDAQTVIAATHGVPLAYSLQIVYLWDREDQVRTDGVYRGFNRPSLFKLTAKDLTFKRTDFGGNFHCSSVPACFIGRTKVSPARLLHFGYLHREDRIRKYEFYNAVDKNDAVEDFYRHMVIGDLFPAESKFRWGGPLKLEALR